MAEKTSRLLESGQQAYLAIKGFQRPMDDLRGAFLVQNLVQTKEVLLLYFVTHRSTKSLITDSGVGVRQPLFDPIHHPFLGPGIGQNRIGAVKDLKHGVLRNHKRH